MLDKCKYCNGLKSGLTIVSMLLVGACASGNGSDWPKMEADNLWQELEKKQNEKINVSDNTLSIDNPSSLNAPLVRPPFEAAPPTLSDIRYSLSEIERDLPLREQDIIAALLRFENADAEDKALHWRGVEIEKSRLIELVGAIRRISYQLRDNNEAADEQALVEQFMQRAAKISPETPEDMTTDRLANQ